MPLANTTLARIETAIARTAGYDVAIDGDALVATRRRFLPARGISRLLFPRARARIDLRAGAPVLTVRPDGWAWLMVVVCAGGLAVEATMDRTHYPREYPPAFVFVITACVVIAIAYDVIRTRSELARVIDDAGR